MPSGLTPYTASSMTARLNCAFTGAPSASVTVSVNSPFCLGFATAWVAATVICSWRDVAGTFSRFSARYSRSSLRYATLT